MRFLTKVCAVSVAGSVVAALLTTTIPLVLQTMRAGREPHDAPGYCSACAHVGARLLSTPQGIAGEAARATSVTGVFPPNDLNPLFTQLVDTQQVYVVGTRVGSVRDLPRTHTR
jgi:hypothetical protein